MNPAGKKTAAGAALVIALGWSIAAAQLNRGTPEVLEDVRIDEQLGAALPLDAEFVDDEGKVVRLGDYFDGTHPVVLTLNYYRCPMLCGLLLNGMLEALKPISLEPGEDYQIVTISFDPLEGPELAKAKKRNYVNAYGRSAARRGWHFLTGQRDAIKAVTQATGFHYKWNEENQQWAHAAALIICTPEGKISRYLPGVVFEPQTVRLSLIEASDGRIGTLVDQVFLTCFQYHSIDGAYSASAIGLMRLGGAATLLVLVVVLLLLWRREAVRRRPRADGDLGNPATPAA